MNTIDKLKEIHQQIEEAISYEDWEAVSEINLELELFIRDYESGSPFGYDDY